MSFEQSISDNKNDFDKKSYLEQNNSEEQKEKVINPTEILSCLVKTINKELRSNSSIMMKLEAPARFRLAISKILVDEKIDSNEKIQKINNYLLEDNIKTLNNVLYDDPIAHQLANIAQVTSNVVNAYIESFSSDPFHADQVSELIKEELPHLNNSFSESIIRDMGDKYTQYQVLKTDVVAILKSKLMPHIKINKLVCIVV
jgi:hypothetical protein